MAIGYVATLFCGITTAFCVPFLYAYYTQASDVTVQPEDAGQNEEHSENREDELVHSLRVKERGTNSIVENLTKTIILKDATETNTTDTTIYRRLPSRKENSPEEPDEVFYNDRLNHSSSFGENRPQGPMTVQADVHAENFRSNSPSFINENLGNRNFPQTVFEKNHLLNKQFFKREKTSKRWKKFLTGIRKGKFSKPSSSKDSSHTSVVVFSGTRRTSLEDTYSSPTFKRPTKPSIVHSTLRDSKQKVALMFHEVNGLSSIHIESPIGSATSSLSISVENSLPTIISESKSINLLIKFQETVASSDQDTQLNDTMCFNRLHKSLPGRLRSTATNVENLRKFSSTF